MRQAGFVWSWCLVAQDLDVSEFPAISDIAPDLKILVVSAVDSRFLPLLKGLMTSIASILDRPNVNLACFDIGLAPADRAWLASRCEAIVAPGMHFGLDADSYPVPLRSFLARPFLPQYFPGHDIYVWIDSDVWLQDLSVFDRYVAGAQQSGLAVSHESERAYRLQPWLFGWTAKHFLKGYGPMTGAALLARQHLNAGFFAGAADAPHWAAWAQRYEAAIRHSGALVPHDQFALVQAVHMGAERRTGGLHTAILAPENNWICDRGVPMWNDVEGLFCKPYAPFEPIGALHLAGPAKATAYVIRRTNGGTFNSFISHGATPAHPVTRGPLPPIAAAPLPV